MGYFAIGIVIGLIPGYIAHRKGHSFLIWWIFGAALFIVAFPISLMMGTDKEELEKRELDNGSKKCPKCAEVVKGEALVCRFCQFEFEKNN